MRLVYTDAAFTGNVGDADVDGDGVSNAEEVSIGVRTDPFRIDSDLDGLTDSDELSGGSDPNSFNTAASVAQPEQTAQSPRIGLNWQTKYVTNTWRKWPTGNGTDYKETSMWWETTPNGVQDSAYFPNEFDPKWASQLASLAYPNPDSSNANHWHSEPYYNGFNVSSFGTHADYSSGTTTSLSAEVKHYLLTWRTPWPAPWNLASRALRFTRTVPSRTTGASVYSGLSTEMLRMNTGNSVTNHQIELKPAVVETKRTNEVLSLLDFSVSAYPRSLDLFSTLTLNSVPQPMPWLMLPLGQARQLSVSYGGPTTEHAFEVTGAGFEGSPPTVSFSTLTLTGPQEGTAQLKVGLSPDGSIASAQMFPDPVLNLAVYGRKECEVRIQPIGYQFVPGGVTGQPTSLPSEASLQTFLDRVFLDQANIKMKVTLLPLVGVAWDQGLGSLFLPAPNAPIPTLWHASDRVLQVLHPLYEDRPTWYTNEDAAILAAAPPSQDPHTITVYWVVAQGMTWVHWDDEVAEANRMVGESFKRMSIYGFAHMGRLRSSGNVAWVLDRPSVGSWSASTTLAHELGHMLGLLHVFDTQSSFVKFLNGENELRLMSDRSGPKKHSGPTNLVHEEWVIMRRSQLLNNSNE